MRYFSKQAVTLTPLRRGFFRCLYTCVTLLLHLLLTFAVAATVGVATVAPVLVNSVNWTTLVPTVVAGHVLRKSLSKGL